MDNLALAGQFQPPSPYSVTGYFDVLTKDKFTEQSFRTLNIFAFNLDGVLNTIATRQDPVERAALLDVLESRLRLYGEANGYLEPPKGSEKNAGSLLTNFFIKDILGLSGDSAEQKAISELQSLLRKGIELGLNDRGKSQLKFLKWVWDVADAGNAQDRWRMVLAGAGEQLTKVLRKYEIVILNAMKRRGPVSKLVVARLRKIIALRMAWRVTLVTRFAWVSPVLLALDLLLTPSEIGSDAKLEFLGAYTRVCEDRRILLSTILERCSSDEWKYKFEPIDALRAAIKQG